MQLSAAAPGGSAAQTLPLDRYSRKNLGILGVVGCIAAQMMRAGQAQCRSWSAWPASSGSEASTMRCLATRGRRARAPCC